MQPATIPNRYRSERRARRRVRVALPARLGTLPRTIPCQVHDLSVAGALVEARGQYHIGQSVHLDIDGIGPVPAHVVRVTSWVVALAFDEYDPRIESLVADYLRQATGVEPPLQQAAVP